MRFHIHLSRRHAKELRSFAKECRTTCSLVADAALRVYLPQLRADEGEPATPTGIAVSSARLMPTGGLIVDYADGETTTVSSMEVTALFGAIVRCEVAVDGFGLRLFDAEGHVAWYPAEFFWTGADPLLRAACDRAGLLRRVAFGRRIRKGRKRRGWTVLQLARESSVPRKVVKALEAGRACAAKAQLDAVAAAIGIEYADLLG